VVPGVASAVLTFCHASERLRWNGGMVGKGGRGLLPLWLMLFTPTPSLPRARTISPSILPVMETLPKVR